jgi:hypothetical protein
MSLDKKLIKKVLAEVHPDNSITNETIEWLIKLFHKYDNMTREQVIDDMNGELIKHASKNDTKDKVVEYLLAEILELAGTCTRDHHRMKITILDIWLGILGDAELTLMFPHPSVHVIPKFDCDKYGAHKKLKKYRPSKKMLNEQLNTIMLNSDAKFVLYNTLFQCNLYYDKNTCIEKIKSLGKTYDEKLNHLEQLRLIVLDLLKQKLTLLSGPANKTITFTDVNTMIENIVTEYGSNYEFLKNIS